jgi:hypothetical protein
MYASTQRQGASHAVRSGRTWIVATAALLAVSGVLFVWLVTHQQSGSTSAKTSNTSVSLQSGPNESLRGIAASTAATGVLPTPGGPSESARGAAVHSATAPALVSGGGPSEAARGAAVRSAAANTAGP